MYTAEELVNKIDGVYKVKYNGETLYNVLLDTPSKMIVNNLISETLDPENIIAKFYMCDFSYEEINTMKKENNK